MAVTDHHSADAWEPMQQRLDELSQAGHAVPTLWSGCEISCVLETCLVHVLALGYDRSHSAIAPYLQGDAVIGDQLEAAAVVEAIHASSGLAVLAHPARYRLGFKPLMRAASAWASMERNVGTTTRCSQGGLAHRSVSTRQPWRPISTFCSPVASHG